MLGIMPSKKKMAQTIVSRSFSDGGEVEAAVETESDDQIAMQAIGEDIMKAIEGKNPIALAESIKTLMMIAQTPDIED